MGGNFPLCSLKLSQTDNSVLLLVEFATTSDINKWTEQIPTDTPFHNDFINHWNTYLGDNIKDITMSYTDWMRESFQLIFDNLKPGEEIIADLENPDLFIIRSLYFISHRDTKTPSHQVF